MDNTGDEIYTKIKKYSTIDFCGTTYPIIIETWLKRTQRALNSMKCTLEEKFDYAVSLL